MFTAGYKIKILQIASQNSIMKQPCICTGIFDYKLRFDDNSLKVRTIYNKRMNP